MNRTLYLIPPIVNQTTEQEINSGVYDIFQQPCSPVEQFFYGKQGAIASCLTQNASTADAYQIWACAQLVHIHATRDHLVLTDPNLLSITTDEETELKESVQYLLDELASNIISTDNHWIFPAGQFESLKTHSPAQAIGRNIDIWMPKDTEIVGIAKKWRQIQNEIQMIWHDHPVNQRRVLQGELPINSIWLYGIGSVSDIKPNPMLQKVNHVFSSQSTLNYLMRNLKINFSLIDQINLKNIPDSTLIDAHNLNLINYNQWNELWVACLNSLHENAIDTLSLINPIGGSTLRLDLSKEALKPNLIQKLFFKNKAEEILHPSYETIIKESNLWKEFS